MPRSKDGLARLIAKQGLADGRIVEAFKALDRADFVPNEAVRDAYQDRPVGIFDRQTTSQPSLIAKMIDWARVSATDKVLEVGTGFGFQTALLARLAASVYSIERSFALAERARSNLEKTGISGVEIVVGDGWNGLSGSAPYDAIIVSAAASRVPTALKEQLTEGGRLVIPIAEGNADNIYLFERNGGTTNLVRLLTPARFVPLVPDP